MRRALLLPLVTAAVAGCGGGDGGGAEATGPSLAAGGSPPAGFVTVKGSDFSVARPGDMQPQAVQGVGKDATLSAFQLGTDEGDALPSQVIIGSAPAKGSLSDSVLVTRETEAARLPGYHIRRQGPVRVPGGRAFRIEATYPSIETTPRPVRAVEVLVHTDGGRQISLDVRGPDADFERLGLDRVVSSLRLR